MSVSPSIQKINILAQLAHIKAHMLPLATEEVNMLTTIVVNFYSAGRPHLLYLTDGAVQPLPQTKTVHQ